MSATFYGSLPWHLREEPAVCDGGPWVSYAELAERTRSLAGLVRQHYGSGHYLLVRATPSCEFVVWLLGIMASGNTPVPINPECPAAELEYLREKCHAVDVVDPGASAALPVTGAAPGDWTDPQRPAMILFTSGTSGFPKGVIITHDGMLHSCRTVAGYLDYARFPSAAVVLPLHYSYALLSQVCAMLLTGGRVRIFPEFRNPIQFARTVEEDCLETFCGVPSTYYALSVLHGLSPLSMPSVRVLCSAGAAMDRSRLETIQQIFPRARFFNNYGMTEAAPRISYLRDDDPRFFQPTCGRPMSGVEVRVVDPQTHRPLADGQVGMLVVRGPNITPGYLNDPEQTQKAFTGDGWLISGDLAHLDEGYIYIAGRNDDIFNVGGEKVAPLEIERVLSELPEVELAAVAGLPDPQRGMIPVAYLKLREPVSRKALLAALRGRLVPNKLPQRFFAMRSFPMTANAKLQRRQLSPDDATHVIEEIR